tara:strand:+ start:24118 stop:25692 length:1575 start_codon:yes stop_codon:yes gene_type:complete
MPEVFDRSHIMIKQIIQYKKILPAISIVGLGFVFARLTGIIKTIVIANQFGTSPEIAAYWVAFRIPDLLFNLLAGATLSAAFIPIFNKVVNKEGDRAGWELSSSIINILTLVTLIFCIVAFIFTAFFINIIAPGLNQEINELAIDLTRIMLASPIFFCISGMSTGILNGKNHFIAPAIAPTIYNISIIFGAMYLSSSSGVQGLAFSVVIGSIGHLLVQLFVLRGLGMEWSPSFNFKSKNVKEVITLALPRTIGLAANQINLIIFILFASKISEENINAFNYAHMFIMLPVALIGMSVSIAIFPKISSLFILKKFKEFHEYSEKTINLIIFLSIPAMIGILSLAQPMTKLIFEHGQFDPNSTILVKNIVILFTPIIFAFSLTEIFSRIYYAAMDTKTPVVATVISVIINVLICSFAVGKFGYQSIAVAGSIAALSELSFLIYRLKKKGIIMNYQHILADSMRVLIVSFGMYLIIQLIDNIIVKKYLVNEFLSLFVLILVGIISYFALFRICFKQKYSSIIHFLKA